MNIYNLDTEKFEIMEQGITFFEDLRDMKDTAEKAGHRLIDAIIQVKRRGTGQDDTSYRLDIVGYEPLTNVQFEDYKSKTINLSEYFKPHTSEQILRVVNGEKFDDVMKGENSTPPDMEEEKFTIQ
jgi:uncharacterized LabA/DUF88 family protein